MQNQSGNAKNHPKHEIIGQGAYGVVVKPALSNRNKQGMAVEYPKNVTKIFKTWKDYQKAYQDSVRLQQEISGLDAQAYPYRKGYTLRTLHNSISGPVASFLKNQQNKDDFLPLLRMPNLGSMVYHIDFSPYDIFRLRMVPYQTICLEILKSMDIVQQMVAKGKIHGDLRESNVMCDVNTGKITIIDFDLYMPADDYFRRNWIFSYYHPPECLFVWGRLQNRIMYNAKLLARDEATIQAAFETVRTQFDVYDSAEAAKGGVELATLFFGKTTNKNVTQKETEALTFRKPIFDISKQYIDSYGLALSMHRLLHHVWDIPFRGEERQEAFAIGLGDIELGLPQVASGAERAKEHDRFLKVRAFLADTLLPGMMHSNYKQRMDIQTAIREFTNLLESIGIHTGATANSIHLSQQAGQSRITIRKREKQRKQGKQGKTRRRRQRHRRTRNVTRR